MGVGIGGAMKDPKTKQKVCGLTRKFNFNNKIGMVLTVCILCLLKSPSKHTCSKTCMYSCVSRGLFSTCVIETNVNRIDRFDYS